LEVVILNDEAAPSKIEIGLTFVDSLAELLSDGGDDEENFFFVCLKIVLPCLWEYHVLTVANFLHFSNKK